MSVDAWFASVAKITAMSAYTVRLGICQLELQQQLVGSTAILLILFPGHSRRARRRGLAADWLNIAISNNVGDAGSTTDGGPLP